MARAAREHTWAGYVNLVRAPEADLYDFLAAIGESDDHLARAFIVIATFGVARDVDLSHTGVVSREAQKSGLCACQAVIETDTRAAMDGCSIKHCGLACREQDSHRQGEARTSHASIIAEVRRAEPH